MADDISYASKINSASRISVVKFHQEIFQSIIFIFSEGKQSMEQMVGK
jgi:hypothetical protein